MGYESKSRGTYFEYWVGRGRRGSGGSGFVHSIRVGVVDVWRRRGRSDSAGARDRSRADADGDFGRTDFDDTYSRIEYTG